MAGYSGTPLAKKLGIKPGARLLVVNEPDGLRDWLAPLPEGIVWCGEEHRDLDVVHFFTTDSSELIAGFPALAGALKPNGGLWISWPKRSAQVPTDLDGNRIRKIGLAAGLVDNKVCAVSDVWSGLRFVRRLKDRKG